jgi:hypothetical protein
MRRLSIEIPDTVHRQIKLQATLEGVTIREYVLRRLRIESQQMKDDSPETNAPAANAYPDTIQGWLNRPTRGTRSKAEIDAYIAEERAGWHDDE